MIDNIYDHTLTYKNGDVSETLYILMFVFLQHRSVTIDIPSPLPDLEVNLLSPQLEIFLRKNAVIPTNLFRDPFSFETDDRDKLSHFFGSAYLSYNRFGALTLLIGFMIEATEDMLVEGNEIDNRDLQANNLGYNFGKYLRMQPFLFPSTLFIFHNLKYFFITAR